MHGVNKPFASFSINRSTFVTVRLKATTLNSLWSATLRRRFWPITARPMRPKSPLGVIRAGPPTLMPARRALQSAENSHQYSSALPDDVTNGVLQRIRGPESECSGGTYVWLKRGSRMKDWEGKIGLHCFVRHLGCMNDCQVV